MNTAPLERQITRRTRGAAQNISGMAQELARNLGAYQGTQRDIYNRADESLGKIDTAIADRLGTTGAAGADALKKQLELSGQSPAMLEQLAGGAATAAHGASAAGFARGSAERSALASKRAGAEEYGAKLPALALLSGQQGVRDVEARGQRDLADMQSRTPSLISSAIRDARNREVNKAVAGLGYQSDIYGQNAQTQRTQHSQGAQTGRTRAQIDAANERARLDRIQRAKDRRERIRARKAREARERGGGNTGGSNPIIP